MMMIMMMTLLVFAFGCYLSEINLNETVFSFKPADMTVMEQGTADRKDVDATATFFCTLVATSKNTRGRIVFLLKLLLVFQQHVCMGCNNNYRIQNRINIIPSSKVKFYFERIFLNR